MKAEWKPIKTAPKDNIMLLLCSMQDPENPLIDVGYWETCAFWTGKPKCKPRWEWPHVNVKPTHWMSLPEPPNDHLR